MKSISLLATDFDGTIFRCGNEYPLLPSDSAADEAFPNRTSRLEPFGMFVSAISRLFI